MNRTCSQVVLLFSRDSHQHLFLQQFSPDVVPTSKPGMTAVLHRPAASKFILHPIVFRIRTLTHSEYLWRSPARCTNHLGRCGSLFLISTTNGWSTRRLYPVYTLGTIDVCGSHPSMLIVFNTGQDISGIQSMDTKSRYR